MKEPGYSAVVVAGLGIGIAVCFLLLGFVRYSLSYDAHVPDNERIYLANVQFNYAPTGVDWSQDSPQALVAAAASSGLALEASGYVGELRSVVVENVVHELELHMVGPSFPAMFGITPVAKLARRGAGRQRRAGPDRRKRPAPVRRRRRARQDRAHRRGALPRAGHRADSARHQHHAVRGPG
ncbi:ABC transporter permease [Massilia sp. B-10]|nr:ABC transporter permease [Massilia sp. B-10]UUZ56157.1 ABC transporter permease [Massilia sp. H-1]